MEFFQNLLVRFKSLMYEKVILSEKRKSSCCLMLAATWL